MMTHQGNIFRLICCLALTVWLNGIARSQEADIYCPAINRDNRVLHEIVPRVPRGRIVLIVVGTVRNVGKAGDRLDPVLEIDVEDVIYGYTDKSKLRARNNYTTIGERRIVALCADDHYPGVPYAARYDLPTDEIWSQRLLAKARLETDVWSAAAVFVGRLRKQAGEDSPELIDVDRVLTKGTTVGSQVVLKTISGRQSAEPLIFLASSIDSEKNQPAICSLGTPPLALKYEEDVRAALIRMLTPLQPVSSRPVGSLQRREIVFEGTLDDAARLLSSVSEPSSTLGARRLILGGHEALDFVAGSIGEKLTRPVLTDAEARQQQNLIKVLAILANSDGDARRVFFDKLEKLVRAIEEGIVPPKWPDDFAESQFRVVDALPMANHSLAWLIEWSATPLVSRPPAFYPPVNIIADVKEANPAKNGLDDELMDRFADRLIRLRDRLDGVWRQEIQLALDLGRIDDRLAVATAIMVTDGLKPARSQPADWPGGKLKKIVFAADGRTVQSFGDNGLRVTWDTITLKAINRATISSAEKMAIKEWHPNRDWELSERTEDGRQIFSFESSPDLRSRVARVLFADAATGEPLRRKDIALPFSVSNYFRPGLVPGGKYFHIGTQIYDREAVNLVGDRRLSGMIGWMTFSPNGSRYALLFEDPKRNFVVVRVQETLSGRTIAAMEPTDRTSRCAAFSANSKQLAFPDGDTLRILNLP
jgi:hypothetical protein